MFEMIVEIFFFGIWLSKCQNQGEKKIKRIKDMGENLYGKYQRLKSFLLGENRRIRERFDYLSREWWWYMMRIKKNQGL